jgi:hypothetical protein
MGFSGKSNQSKTILRATRETETTKENIQDWLELDEGEPGFQFVVF